VIGVELANVRPFNEKTMKGAFVRPFFCHDTTRRRGPCEKLQRDFSRRALKTVPASIA
jgi:hypothetical protein